MELWIRSQKREEIMKVSYLEIDEEGKENFLIIARNGDPYFDQCLGLYKTKERALEVLDEIQSKLKQQFIVKADVLMSDKDIDMEEIRLNHKYNNEFIMQDNGFEILPVNSNVLIYEMPKE